MNTRQKVTALRQLMKKHGLDMYFVPSADPHQSEYLPENWKFRSWLSGFTGSAGELLVGIRKAALWTDGRYFLQAGMQLEGSGITMMKLGVSGTPDMATWAISQLKKGQTLGMDPTVVSVEAAADFENRLLPHGIKVKFLTRNLVQELWTDRPEASLAPLAIHPVKYSGESTASKLKRVRAHMKTVGAKAHVLGALDQIAWLLNIRSKDIMYTPVATSYVVVTDRGCTLYVDDRKVTKVVTKALKGKAAIKSYSAVWADLKTLGSRKGMKVWIDAGATNRRVVDSLGKADLHYAASPITAMKAVKNPVQIEGFVEAHRRDGVAMVRFLRWLEKAVPKGGVTEISASDQLHAFRAEGENFMDLSFDSISGYGANGAIIHYSATPETDTKLKPRGIYLIDSGGQYPEGTTDITRTVALGNTTRREIECFTRVLMGTIDCTITPFPEGTTGQRQEMFARRALWMIGEDYAHGTGHGVGQYLGVHEGPHSLKNIVTPPLVEGNILSIEPGHYEAGKFGIRIENLAFVVRDEKLSRKGRTWFTFHPVTLCPIDRRLIDKKLLTKDQLAWLNAYHTRVYRELAPRLDKDHKVWLKKATRPL